MKRLIASAVVASSLGGAGLVAMAAPAHAASATPVFTGRGCNGLPTAYYSGGYRGSNTPWYGAVYC